MPDPTCLVNGSPTPQDVPASSTVNGALANPAGARFWSVSCLSTDDLSTAAGINAGLTIDQTHKTFAFTSTGLGSCYRFQSVVGVAGLGLDADSKPVPGFTTTFEVNVLTASGKRVFAFDEEMEQDPVFGWIVKLNAAIRAIGGGGGATPDVVLSASGSANIDASAQTGNVLGYFKALTGDVTYKLPAAPTAGFRHRIKDLDGSLASHSITILRNGSGSIDTVASDLVLGPDATLAKTEVELTFLGADGWARG
jgi:hypothetical protein